MISLATGGTLKGKAGTATAITYTLSSGDSVSAGADTFQILGQGQLPSSTGDLLSTTPVPSSTVYLIDNILFTNTTASPVTGIVLYVNGSASGNQIVQFSMVANGSTTYAKGEWKNYDSSGNLLFGSGFVVSVSAADSSITVGGTSTAPTVSRAALTGDVTASAGSNTTVLANIPNATPAAGDVLFTNIVAPATPASGKTMQYVDSTSKNMASKNDAGTVNHGVQTRTATASNWIRAIADDGSTTISQPVAADVSGAVATTRNINTTAPITGGGDLSADRTIAISAASTSAAGSMSAADKNTVNNIWYDVTNYGVSISNSGAANVAAMNTLIQTTAAGPFTFYFPPTGANYPMAGTITVTKNGQTFAGAGMRSSVIFGGNTTQDLFFITDAVTNVTFQDLGFWSTTTQTAGAVVDCGTVSGTGNQQMNFYRLGMEGFGGNWFNGFVFNGTRGAEVANIEDCVLNSFTGWGIAMVGNTTIPNTTSALTITNTLMNGNINGTTGAIAGIYCQQVGALQINNSDIIQCTNSILAAPITSSAQVVASIFANNSYFDSSYGSCVKLGGTQPIVRCKFVSCSMTVSAQAAAPNANAFEISNTSANPPADIDLLNCNFQNTFNNTNASNGILIGTGMNVKIVGNNINGWTNGIQVTPSAAGVTRLNIIGNNIGPGSISHTASATGILLNAGSAAYGLVQILDNVFPLGNAYQVANTANITDNSTLGVTTAATGQKIIANNSGLVSTFPANYTATVIPITTVTNVDSRGGIFIPAGVRPSSGRVVVYATNSASAQTLTVTTRFGTNNSNADAAIQSTGLSLGTAAVGSGVFYIDWEILSSTTMITSIKFFNGNNTTTGISAQNSAFAGGSAPVTISTAANSWFGVYFSSTVASVVTVRSVKYEVQSQ